MNKPKAIKRLLLTAALLGLALAVGCAKPVKVAPPPPPQAKVAPPQVQGWIPHWDRLVIWGARQTRGSIVSNIAQVRQGTVAVLAGRAAGTGFFISAEGHLLTNAHVVRGADNVTLKLAGGRQVPARVLRADDFRDVALLKAWPGSYTPLPLARHTPNQGELVYALSAVSNEVGGATVTRGQIRGQRNEYGKPYLQCDAMVRPGNSGGPLIDASGNVVAITVTSIPIYGAVTGLNFFIPIADALLRLGIDLRLP